MNEETKNRLPPEAEHTHVFNAVIRPNSPAEKAECEAFAKNLSMFLHDEINRYFEHPNRKLFYMFAAVECQRAATISAGMALSHLPVSLKSIVPTILGHITADVLSDIKEKTDVE